MSAHELRVLALVVGMTTVGTVLVIATVAIDATYTLILRANRKRFVAAAVEDEGEWWL